MFLIDCRFYVLALKVASSTCFHIVVAYHAEIDFALQIYSALYWFQYPAFQVFLIEIKQPFCPANISLKMIREHWNWFLFLSWLLFQCNGLWSLILSTYLIIFWGCSFISNQSVSFLLPPFHPQQIIPYYLPPLPRTRARWSPGVSICPQLYIQGAVTANTTIRQVSCYQTFSHETAE